ncbi:MAG: hypothetical protein LC104_22370 [Bacteroidales bacterium]|nr:hypothetical protein [Bacteroidales bacterium]
MTVRSFVLIAAALMMFLPLAGSAQEPKLKEPKPPLPKLPTGKELMALKAKHAQDMLAALAIEDYDRIAAAAEEIGRIAQAAEFLTAYKTAEYEIQMKLFVRTVGSISKHARNKNLDATMLSYIDMSMSCIKCHKYTRDRKDVRHDDPARSSVIVK